MTTQQTERPTLPKALRRDSMWTLGVLALTAVAWAMEVPASFLVVITGPATIALAISALVHARGVEGAATIRIWLWIAIGVGGMSLLAGLGLILMRGPIEQFEACTSRAITETARRECTAEYDKEYQEQLDRYSSYGTGTKP